MAKKNYTVMRRNSKMEPAHLRFQVALPTLSSGTPTSTSYVDLSQIASLLNRRFYRQGLNWVVSSIKHSAITNDGSLVNDGLVSVHKLPETWVFSNAWMKSFKAWQQMIKNATDESGSESIKGKFLDFKIYADAEHHAAGFGANLLPMDGAGGLYTAGQWQPSEIEIPSGVSTVLTREFIGVGPNLPGVGPSGYDAVSLVTGYANSRALPSPVDPNVPADASGNWMVKLFDSVSDQDQAVVADLEVMGNNPPYPFEGDVAGNVDTMYPGGETNAPTLVAHDFTYITSTTVGGESYLAPGCFPCGLMKIITGATLAEGSQLFQGLTIELVPGYHRGYLAESMTEL